MTGDKFRFRFGKSGTLRLVSHHDLMRCCERMLRRAAVPFKSTNGFHPTPRLVFALSLPLGAVGRDEVVELELTEPRDGDALLASLAAQAPVGLTFTSVAPIPMKTTARVRRVVYELPLPADRVPPTERACAALLAEPKVWVERLKPSAKRLNIRPYVRALRVESTPTPQPPPPGGEGVNSGQASRPSSDVRGVGVPFSPFPSGWGAGGVGAARDDVSGLSMPSATLPSPRAAETAPAGEARHAGQPGEGQRAKRAGWVSAPRLVLDLWVTQEGTARADELIDLLNVADLIDAGAVLERTTVELRDEITLADPTDVPPDGPSDSVPLTGPEVAALVARLSEEEANQQPAEAETGGGHRGNPWGVPTPDWGASPNGPVVE